MMQKLFPSPLLSLGLAIMWLMLNETLSLGHLILAVVFGLVLPVLFAPLRPQQPRIRQPFTIARYIVRIGWDVLLSNLQVAGDLLRYRRRPVHSAFVAVPLSLRDPSALAALAMVTAVVPGTVWCELARDSNAVLLHVWNVEDEAEFIAHYKRTYEAPLLEIFQ